MWKLSIAAILLIFAGSLPGKTADLLQVGPQASAAQILAARGTPETKVLRLIFAVSGGNFGTPATMRVDLASDYVLVQTASSTMIYDYRLRRLIKLDEAHRSFVSLSLYAMADFRRAETYNRRMERRMLAAASINQAVDILDPFWVQAELHVLDPADIKPEADRSVLPDGSVHFTYKASEVAAYSLSEEKLTESEKSAFRHLLMEKAVLSPSIIAALASAGRVPQRLSFVLPPITKKGTEVWSLQSSSRVFAPYPLAADYVARPGEAGEISPALADLLPMMLDAVAGRAATGPRTVGQYRSAIEDAYQKKAGFQAALLFLEASEQYGQDSLTCAGQLPCHSLKDVLQAGDNTRAADLMRSFQIESKDPQQAISIRQNLRRDDIVNGYVLDGFIGNTLSATGKTKEAEPLLIREVRGNPYIGGYFKDLGDLYRTSFNPVPAWLCYDLGRALPGGPNAPIIGTINELEAHLVTELPQFF